MDYETMELEALQTINWPSRHSFQHTVDIEREIREIIEKTSNKHLIEGLIDYLDRSLSQTYNSEYNPVNDKVYDKIAEEIISRQNGEKIDFLDRQKKYVLMSAEDEGYIDSEESLENQRAEIKQFLLDDYGRNFLASRNDSVKKDISRDTVDRKQRI